jgi:citrate lyase subunit beta/citryl-CoA lyase
MATTVRPRRSVLYMPGSNSRAHEKAQALPVDGIIFDLEAATAPDAKEAGRATVCETVRTRDYGLREKIVRVNGLNTPWGYEDIVQASKCGADAILIPKVESGDTVLQTLRIMEASGAPASMEVWAMIETPKAILRIEEIAASTARLGCFVMGTSDLVNDLHAQHTRDRLPVLASLSMCLLAARAYDLAIVDGVHIDLNDEEGYLFACRQGAELGFDGKTLIHPKQVAAANEAFAPSAKDIEWSRRIMVAFEEALAQKKSVLQVDGKLIEDLHIAGAKRVLKLAEAIEKLKA